MSNKKHSTGSVFSLKLFSFPSSLLLQEIEGNKNPKRTRRRRGKKKLKRRDAPDGKSQAPQNKKKINRDLRV